MAFQFDQNDVHSGAAGVLGQVGAGGSVHGIAGLEVEVLRFPVRKSELPLGVGEGYRHRIGMAVHHRLLARPVVHPQNPYLIVFADDRVMLGVDLSRILGRDDGRETEAHCRTTKRKSHSHVALLRCSMGLNRKTAQPYAALSAMSNKVSSVYFRRLCKCLADISWWNDAVESAV